MISSDIRNCEWLKNVPSETTAFVAAEGVSMYMQPEKFRNALYNLALHFNHICVLADFYT